VDELKKTSDRLTQMRLYCSYLVSVWIGLFLYGVKETIEGKITPRRAIPAGAFLLFFIGIFGWSLYRSWAKKSLT
jgi:hypothetical protein